jgi:hypothetical protein
MFQQIKTSVESNFQCKYDKMGKCGDGYIGILPNLKKILF